MTLICIDTKGTIAADGLMVCGGLIVSRSTEKIRTVDGRIYAMSGTRLFWEPLIEWHRAGAKLEDAPRGEKGDEWCLIVVDRAGMWQYEWDIPRPDRLDFLPWAWGSNSDVAIGLMLAGKTAEEAVRIMSEQSVWVGGKIQVVNIAEALGLQKRDVVFARNPLCDRPECQTTLGCQCRMEAAE